MKRFKAPIMAGFAVKHHTRLFNSYSSCVLIIIPMEWLGGDWFIVMGLITIE
jgi:hypothetical protein